MMNPPEQTLKPAHGVLAARELLADLLRQQELRRYIIPELWLAESQEQSILAKTNEAGICVAVGLGEDSLPHPNDSKQGGCVNIGLAVYVFVSQQLTATAAMVEELQRVWLTVLHYCHRFYYTPAPAAQKIKAKLTTCAEVDLNEISTFTDKVNAQALMMELPVSV